MKAFGHAFNNKPLPLHFLLGLDERVTPLDDVTIDGFTFFSACAQSKIDVALTFLLSGFDVNATEINSHNVQPELRGLTGLHYAARSGDYALVQLLLNEGAVVDSPSAGNGITPLMLALAGGHIEVIKQLIAHGASPTRPDDHGDPAIFYGALQPVALHVCKTMLNLNFATILSKEGQTLLHAAARSKGSRNTLLYLCEMGGVDANTADSRGETALHVAARVNDIDAIKGLLSKGASITVVNQAGKTPPQQRETKHAALMEKCARESNKTLLERMTLPDASNLANIDMKQGQHFLVAFTVPNILLWIGATLPSFIGMFLAFGSAFGFTLVAKFALSQKNRSLATAGWFSGALTFGSYVLVTRIFPVFAEDHPYGSEIVSLWWIFTTLMYISYARAVLADPGAVQSSAEKRRYIIEAVARDGEAAVKREHIDMTTFTKKPLRSKHCNKTHFTVYRFDHYCVWTGNAIAGGNHRPFVHYCLWQTFSQIIVSYTTFKTLFGYAITRSKTDVSGFFGYLDWTLNADNTLVAYFLIFYNSFVFLFVSTVVITQLWYATRNVTSNEVWFPDRYEWMFTLGSRAYCMFDQGIWKNVVEFFWNGNLCAEIYVVPKMNEYLTLKTRQYAAQAKSRQQAGGNNGMSGLARNGMVPTGISTGGEVGTAAQDFSGSIPSTNIENVASPLSPTEALTELQSLLPPDKQQEMAVTQELIEQMIAGATEPVVPASVTNDAQRKELVRKAKMMFRHLQQATGAIPATSSSSNHTD